MNLKIDGIATSEHIDSSGELLIVENHDITDLIEGKGVLNFEHSSKAEDIVGAVIYAKKIMKKEDCENDRQRHYWNFSKRPFVYIIGELFEDQEHSGAIAVAAMIRYYASKDERLLVGFSIEGATLEREDYILKESVGRRVAITLRSCNKMAIAGLFEDPKAKKIAKSIRSMSVKIAESLAIDSAILDDAFMPTDPIMDLYKALEDLNKTLEAGMGNVAPSQLTGQAALTREHVTGFQRNRVKAAIRDWDRKRPLKEVVKAALPEVDDNYIHHFEQLAEELALKKALPSTKLLRIGASHSPNKHASDEQKKLIEGLYFDPKKSPKEYLPGHSEYTNALHKLKNDSGQTVIVKNPRAGAGMDDEVSPDRDMDNAQAATHYYHLANEVFGMGDHVPVTNYFKHDKLKPVGEGIPKGSNWGSGEHHQAMEHVKAKPLMSEGLKDMANRSKRHADTGQNHKLMMMDSILGNTDRHVGNVLVGPKGHLINIDNDFAFSHFGNDAIPSYIGTQEDHDEEAGLTGKLHPEAAKWIKTIDPKHLVGKMMDQGHKPATIKAAAAGLKMWQRLADRPDQSVNAMWHNAGGAIIASHAQSQREAAAPVAAPKKKAV